MPSSTPTQTRNNGFLNAFLNWTSLILLNSTQEALILVTWTPLVTSPSSIEICPRIWICSSAVTSV